MPAGVYPRENGGGNPASLENFWIPAKNCGYDGGWIGAHHLASFLHPSQPLPPLFAIIPIPFSFIPTQVGIQVRPSFEMDPRLHPRETGKEFSQRILNRLAQS